MKQIDSTSIKICDVSDDEIGVQPNDDDDDDVAGAVGPAPVSSSVAQSQPQYPHLHQYHQPHSPPVDHHHYPTATTSPPTSADGFPRTSKHSRTRAPVHQSKAATKLDADMLLMETSLVIINQSPSPILPTVHQPHHHHRLPHSKPTSPTGVPLPSSTNSSPHQPIQLPGALTSPVQTPIAKHYQQIKEHQELVQKLAEQHQKHSKPMSPPQPTSADRSAVGHFTPRSQHHHRPHPLVMPSNSAASNELELVLSPSKLGL